MRAAAMRCLAWVGSSCALSACVSMSGLGGQSDYACKAPAGVTCESVSGVYANAAADKLPSQRRRASTAVSSATVAPAPPAPPAPSTAATIAATVATSAPPPSATGLPLRSSPRILRLWFKPWEDADGDLFDQGYLYVQIDAGRWLVEHAQRAIRESHAPVRAAAARAASDASSSPPSSSSPATPQRPDHLIPRPTLGAPSR